MGVVHMLHLKIDWHILQYCVDAYANKVSPSPQQPCEFLNSISIPFCSPPVATCYGFGNIRLLPSGTAICNQPPPLQEVWNAATDLLRETGDLYLNRRSYPAPKTIRSDYFYIDISSTPTSLIHPTSLQSSRFDTPHSVTQWPLSSSKISRRSPSPIPISTFRWKIFSPRRTEGALVRTLQTAHRQHLHDLEATLPPVPHRQLRKAR